MLNIVKKGFVMSALGLALTIFSNSAFSASGPVTYLYYIADYYTLLVSAGGVSCGVTSNNIEPAKIAGAVAMLAAAKANGTNVSLYCSSGSFQVSMQ